MHGVQILKHCVDYAASHVSLWKHNAHRSESLGPDLRWRKPRPSLMGPHHQPLNQLVLCHPMHPHSMQRSQIFHDCENAVLRRSLKKLQSV